MWPCLPKTKCFHQIEAYHQPNLSIDKNDLLPQTLLLASVGD